MLITQYFPGLYIDTFVAFIDFQKAFDWVNRDCLFLSLLETMLTEICIMLLNHVMIIQYAGLELMTLSQIILLII